MRRTLGGSGPISIRPLGSVADNRAWQIRNGTMACIAKLPERNGGLTVHPALEYELMQRAAEAGVAPRPLGFDSQSEIIFVEQLEEVREAAPESLSEAQQFGLVADTLRRLHAMPAPARLRVFDPLVFAQEYFANIPHPAGRDAEAAYQLCISATQRVEHLLSGDRICHNDLHAGNVLFGQRAWLIDFEYAVRAAALVDVASYIALNVLDPAASREFTQAVLGADPGFSDDELQSVVGIHRALAVLWKIARSDNNAPA